MSRRLTIAAGVAVAALAMAAGAASATAAAPLPQPTTFYMGGLGDPDPAQTHTPGYTLYNPGTRTTAYIHNSSKWRINQYRCNTSCTLIDQWDHQLREYLNGGGSKLWALTLNVWRVKGSTPTSFSYSYYCGVDVNNASDYLCNFTNSDHSDSGVMNPGDVVWYSFGNAGTRRVFPMVKISALFSSGIRLETPFRGWDACAGTATTLCSTAKY